MRAQRFGRVIVARKFGFGQGRVDFVVADLMHTHDRPALAALQLGRQVVQALPGVRRDWAQADRADWNGIVYRLILAALTAKRVARYSAEARGIAWKIPPKC